MSTIRYTLGADYDPDSSQAATYSHEYIDIPLYRYFVYVSGPAYMDTYTDPSTQYLSGILDSNGTFQLSGTTSSFYIDISDNNANGQIYGGSFGDLIRSGAGNDTLNGGGGNDTLEGGFGNNTIDGGTGINTLSYEHYQDNLLGFGVNVDLSLGTGVSFLGGNLSDQFSNIQNVRGSALFDLIIGSNLANRIEGGGGPDALYGSGGNDHLILKGGASGAYINGGADYDILVLESGAGPYGFFDGQFAELEQVNLRDGVVADFSQVLTTPGLFRSVSIADGGVSLTTTGQADKIRAGLGEDTFSAGGGNDTILVFDGGSATIDGGAGTDRLLIQSGSHAFTDATLVNIESIVVRSGASLDLGAMTASAGKITSTSVAGDGVTIVGTAGAEWIRLGAGGDVVTGGAGNDTLVGGAGEDTFRYESAGFGRDQLFADLATDHVDLAGVAASLDDLSFRTSLNGLDVIVSIQGLANTDAIVLNDVTIEDVRAAADGFFLF
jgi:Ca2+-binding RTX toxin-like protein